MVRDVISEKMISSRNPPEFTEMISKYNVIAISVMKAEVYPLKFSWESIVNFRLKIQ